MNDYERAPVGADQKLLAIVAHVAWFSGVGFILAPLLIFLLSRDEFVRDHAKQALVAHTAFLVLTGVAAALCFLVIGLLLLPVVLAFFVMLFVVSLLASYRALNGAPYRYPLVQWLVEKL